MIEWCSEKCFVPYHFSLPLIPLKRETKQRKDRTFWNILWLTYNEWNNHFWELGEGECVFRKAFLPLCLYPDSYIAHCILGRNLFIFVVCIKEVTVLLKNLLFLNKTGFVGSFYIYISCRQNDVSQKNSMRELHPSKGLVCYYIPIFKNFHKKMMYSGNLFLHRILSLSNTKCTKVN